MNCTDVIFFHAEIAPQKLAIIAHGAVCSYGRLAQGILSTQRRLAAAGVAEGQTVALNIAHPIDHFIVACALYRLKATSASISGALDAYLDRVPFDVVLSDNVNPVVSSKQPAAKLFLVDTAMFKDKVAFSVAERASSARDSNLDWICRVNCFPRDPRLPPVVKTTSQTFEAQLVTYCLSAFSEWERMITVAPLQSPAGLLLGLTALLLGRTVLFADPASVRHLVIVHKYHYLVGTTQELEPLLTLQATDYEAMQPIRGAWIEGQKFFPAMIEKCLTTVSNNTILSYSHPQIGIVAFGGAARIKEVTGAVGFVAPWVEAQIVGDDRALVPAEKEGELRFRERSDGRRAARNALDAAEGGWIYPGQRGRLMKNNLLVIS
jgi:cyanophycin synthetase